MLDGHGLGLRVMQSEKRKKREAPVRGHSRAPGVTAQRQGA
ncbi:hypothetical protein GLE_5313 [Lysobacter enzymogenes]|uniref:Uncharacterized protein n=1 Tax=Lysobacter enzymogenes TaxID=69 RepID=A0A0S2DPX9_LYSEN|nr:hypothetical protein GLE_5313 [Lysobacter enzymogenes]